eukprot:gene13073-8280_t
MSSSIKDSSLDKLNFLLMFSIEVGGVEISSVRESTTKEPTIEFVNEENIDPLFICSICCEPFKKCTEHPCIKAHHRFCSTCIEKWLENNSNCPICRGYINRNLLKRNTLADEYISELKVFCPFKSKGCQTTVTLSELDHHKKNCKIEAERLEREAIQLVKDFIEKEKKELKRLKKLKEQKKLQKEKEKYTGPKLYDCFINNVEFIGDNLDKDTFSCALGFNGFAGLTRNGYWGIGIPKKLHDIFIGRQKSLPPPVYVDLGSFGRYFVEFENGSSRWSYNCRWGQTMNGS